MVHIHNLYSPDHFGDFPGGSVAKETVCNAGDTGDAGSVAPFPVFLLENSMDRGAWRATVHRVGKSQT